ncbi:hypothetical protein HZ326_20411 [Fusarium oxysporum f. sp. albedinis]|nr:hypothetical protein HZ326_20411 [Fusarium oxysporum f. sp. albedinis]
MQDIISTPLGRELIGVYDAISEPESINPISLILDQIGAYKVGIIVPPRVALSQNFIPTMSVAFEILNEEGSKVLDHIWRQYLPESLRQGRFQLAPSSVVGGKGLGDIQQGLDKLKAGVSG